MKIETKYNTSEKIFFIKDFKIVEATIYSIDIHEVKENEAIIITYSIINENREYYKYNGKNYFPENFLFKTKEELIASL